MEAFGDKNGAPSFREMCRRIEKYRPTAPDPHADYRIGCILLQDPFFFRQFYWVPAPAEFHPNTQQGKLFDLTVQPGRTLWELVMDRYRLARGGVVLEPGEPVERRPVTVLQRVGQGAFKVMVTDKYRRQCAITRERALPVLEAAQIRPVAEGGTHQVSNGLLLRADLHALFDRGYVTIVPDQDGAHCRVRVSGRLKTDYDNGEPYYPLDRQPIAPPKDPADQPSRSCSSGTPIPSSGAEPAEKGCMPMTRARINGIDIDHEVGGQGPPLLLSHGYSATGHMWAPQRPALEPGWR